MAPLGSGQRCLDGGVRRLRSAVMEDEAPGPGRPGSQGAHVGGDEAGRDQLEGPVPVGAAEGQVEDDDQGSVGFRRVAGR